jgi:hypothetical protein
VKLKTLAVITLAVSGCSLASAQIGTFSFFNAAGTTQFCDYNGYLGAGAPEKREVAGHATSAGMLPVKLRK